MSDDIEERMRTLAVKPLCPMGCGRVVESTITTAHGVTIHGCPCVGDGNRAWSIVQSKARARLRPELRREVNNARARLEAAALAIGDCHLAGIDPGWGESNEVEQASILYTQAVRAEQEGT